MVCDIDQIPLPDNQSTKIIEACNPAELRGLDAQEEHQDSDATRNSSGADKPKQKSADQNEKSNTTGDSQSSQQSGKKRKRDADKKIDAGGETSDEDDESKRHRRVKSCIEELDVPEPVCCCPKDVMRCIGILPSLPIVSSLSDLGDSESSSGDELGHTFYPIHESRTTTTRVDDS